MKVGDPLDPLTDIGALIDQKQMARVLGYIDAGKKEGATLICGGKRVQGTFFEPTILCNVKMDMRIAKEETFGPVAPLVRFKTEEEVVHMANDTEYGLASYLYTSDADRIWRVAEALENGMVSVNGGLFANEVTPFGGVKESGIGREGSKYGLDEYLEIKTICITTSS